MRRCCLVAVLLLNYVWCGAQNIAINTTGSAANSSSGLDVDFTNKGLLIPRVSLVSTTDAATITTPATSLMVYNSNAAMTNGSGVGYYYNAGTPASPNWVRLLSGGGTSGSAWLLSGNSGTTAGTNFLGTTDAQDVVIKANNTEGLRLYSGGILASLGVGTAVAPSTTSGYASLALKGGTSNFNINVQDGGGRTSLLWNASGAVGNYLVSSEPATRMLMSINGTTGGLFAFYGAAAGTAGNPITWLQTGYLSSNDQVWFSPRGTSSDFYIPAATGYIGVGTTAPGVKMDIVGNNVSYGGQLRLSATDYTQITFYNSNALTLNAANRLGDIYYDMSSLALHLENQAGSKYISLNQSGGNVGIGNASPGYKLTVTGGAIGGNYGLTPNYAGWNAYGTGDGGAAIYNDNGSYQTLMLVGNNSAGGVRKVSVWDYLTINGQIKIIDGTQAAGRVLMSDASGQGSWSTIAGAGGVTSACGTANYVPKMTSSTAMACSQIFDNGTNVGIATAAPADKLDVTGGNIRLSSYGSYLNLPEIGSTSLVQGIGSFVNGVMTDGVPYYSAYVREAGAWVYPYPDYVLNNHTGLRLAAHSGYGGISFYEELNAAGTAWSSSGREIARFRDDAYSGSYFSSKVGFGTQTAPAADVDIAGTLKIADGTQGAGKVLVSDASGNASWSTVANIMQVFTVPASQTNINSTSYIDITGLSQTITTTATCHFIINTTGSLESQGPPGWGTTVSACMVKLSYNGVTLAEQGVDIPNGNIWAQVVSKWGINYTLTLPAGTYTFKLSARSYLGITSAVNGVWAFYAGGATTTALPNDGTMTIQVIQQ